MLPSPASTSWWRQCRTSASSEAVGPELVALAEHLRTLLVKGDVVVTTVRVEADDGAACFVARDNLSTYGLIEHLLGADAVAGAGAALGVSDARHQRMTLICLTDTD